MIVISKTLLYLIEDEPFARVQSRKCGSEGPVELRSKGCEGGKEGKLRRRQRAVWPQRS